MIPSARSGLYTIRDPCSGDKPFSYAKLVVYCDMETDGGGWIVIQRRNASMGWVNFTRNIADYEKGFGDLDGEFWIGLKNIYELTNQQNMALNVRVWNDTGDSVNWAYRWFFITGKENGYAIGAAVRGQGSKVGSYRAFVYEGRTDMYFTTYDNYTGPTNCGYRRQSGWWYYRNDCTYSNPNGRHQPSGLPGTDPVGERLVWRIEDTYSIYTNSEMKIRPISCRLS